MVILTFLDILDIFRYIRYFSR